MKIQRTRLPASACAALSLLAGHARSQGTCTTVELTPSPTATIANSAFVAFSGNSRFLGFDSTSGALVPFDQNGASDVFLIDRWTGLTERVSVSTTGGDTSGASYEPSISGDGRWFAFSSLASNLVPGDTGGHLDAFLRDRTLGTTRRLSQTALGVGGNHPSGSPSVSADGTVVAFTSKASNLLLPDLDTTYDIYVHTIATGALERITVGLGGALANGDSTSPSISADGRRVAFASAASNLTALDVNTRTDVFVFDRDTGVLTLCSRTAAGVSANSSSFSPALSADGRTVAFSSVATNLSPGDTTSRTDVYVLNLDTNVLTLVSARPDGIAGNDVSTHPAISSNGRFVSITSSSNDLMPPVTSSFASQVYVRDLWTGQLRIASALPDGSRAPESSYRSAMSADGSLIAFWSFAVGFTQPPDADLGLDLFLRDCNFDTPTSYCSPRPDSSGCVPAMSSTGVPSASSNLPFVLSAGPLVPQRAGMLFYSTAGPSLSPSFGEFLCLRTPFRRTVGLDSGGTAGSGCSESVHFDFNAWVRSGSDPALIGGARVWAQFWIRDPQGAKVHLTDALAFTLQP